MYLGKPFRSKIQQTVVGGTKGGGWVGWGNSSSKASEGNKKSSDPPRMDGRTLNVASQQARLDGVGGARAFV
jgi:hypothetical protein